VWRGDLRGMLENRRVLTFILVFLPTFLIHLHHTLIYSYKRSRRIEIVRHNRAQWEQREAEQEQRDPLLIKGVLD
jgi:hypothetical protein